MSFSPNNLASSSSTAFNFESLTNADAEKTAEHGDLVNESEIQQAYDKDAITHHHPNLDEIGERLAGIMNHSPFVAFTSLKFSYENGEMVGRVALKPELIGNSNFQILHGGMTATILDTMGGLVGMFEIYKRGQGTLDEQTKKAIRFATVDLRVDYLAPGRGQEFIATAEVIRMGRKGCTTTMLLVNNEGKKIAHGIASYAF